MNRRMLGQAVLLAFWSAFAFVSHANESAYQSLLSRVRAMDKSVDFTEFRLAYVSDPGFAPYEPSKYSHAATLIVESLNAEEFGTTVRHCKKAFEIYYLDPKAHVLCSFAYDQVGDPEASELHRFVADGLLASIRESGDGRTPESAFEVVTISEEYAVLWIDGLQLIEQSLLNIDGHAFDRMEARDEETGQQRTLYFKIDPILTWMRRDVDR